MSNRQIEALVRSLYGIADTPKEAENLVEAIKGMDFKERWLKVENEYKRYCVNCGRKYLASRTNSPSEGFCPYCNSDLNETELRRVQKQRRRAKRMNLPATLTFRQWFDTLKYFDQKCAYCQKAPYTDMEHFVPLKQCDQTKGTTTNNVVPSCQACNYYKKSKNPLSKRSRRYIRIPESDLLRVQNYLDNI